MFGRRFRPSMSDGMIDLYQIRLYPADPEMGFGEEFDYCICPHGSRKEAGQISLRIGESECMYYFGHIGYHIDPPWRGHNWSARACLMIRPLIRQLGKGSVVITADPENMASRKICEKLGCELESVVDVPERLQRKWELSARKCRYIWRV